MSNTNEMIFTVTMLNQEIKHLLEKSFPNLLLEGEISNFSCPASGHWYFSLKDDGAQVRCAMFRGNNLKTNFPVSNGQQVLARARVSLYPARGDFQLIIESLQPAGIGRLQQQFEALKNKLQVQGWFDESHKKAIPEMPERIGIVTSSTGAALRDVLRVLERRYSSADIIIYPCLVQGELAAGQIAEQIRTANERNEVDVLLLTRGGGSIEDLWAFNEEVVAKAIYESELPILTGIGHQIDFTIADFVADLRAATPSAAGEILSPDYAHLLHRLSTLSSDLKGLLTYQLEQLMQNTDWLASRLKYNHPALALKNQQEKLAQLYQSLRSGVARRRDEQKNQLQSLARTLDAVSPLATLARGYSVSKDTSGKIITSSQSVKKNDKIQLVLNQGQLDCIVEKVIP